MTSNTDPCDASNRKDDASGASPDDSQTSGPESQSGSQSTADGNGQTQTERMATPAPPAPANGRGGPAPRGPANACGLMALGCLGAVVLAAAGVFVVFALFVYALSNAAEGVQGFDFGEMAKKKKELRRVVIREGDAKEVAVIGVVGLITASETHGMESNMTSRALEKLRHAREDADVVGVILEMESGGGGITGSDLLHREVRLLREAGKPVVASVGRIAASGGYWTIAPCDHIVANPTASVGSFGVIRWHMTVDDLLQKLGVDVTTIKSTGMKDLGSPFRDLTENERAMFEEDLAYWHARFVEVIAEGRGLDPERVRSLATGEIWNAEEALGHGLVDEVGYFDDAVRNIGVLTGVAQPTLVRYERARFPFQELMQMHAQPAGGVTPRAIADELVRRARETPRLEARWSPETE